MVGAAGGEEGGRERRKEGREGMREEGGGREREGGREEGGCGAVKTGHAQNSPSEDLVLCTDSLEHFA